MAFLSFAADAQGGTNFAQADSLGAESGECIRIRFHGFPASLACSTGILTLRHRTCSIYSVLPPRSHYADWGFINIPRRWVNIYIRDATADRRRTTTCLQKRESETVAGGLMDKIWQKHSKWISIIFSRWKMTFRFFHCLNQRPKNSGRTIRHSILNLDYLWVDGAHSHSVPHDDLGCVRGRECPAYFR